MDPFPIVHWTVDVSTNPTPSTSMSMKCLFFITLMTLCLTTSSAYPARSVLPQPRAIIGIMTQPMTGPDDDHFSAHYVAKLNADYVKQIEGSGGRAVPVSHTADAATLDALFDGLNGLVFPGGADILDQTQYYNASKYMFEKAVAANRAGDHFPVWGTCLGFQLLLVIAANDDVGILSNVTASNLTLPLHLTPDGEHSHMFSSFPSEAMHMIGRGEWLMEQYHHFGVTPETFHKHNMSRFYSILALNYDRDGVEFISAIESHDMPLYGVQFHPERSLFEWTPTEDVAHTTDAVFVAQQFGNFFASEARKSKHHFTASSEAKALIYNWSRDLHYTQPSDPETNQYYLFTQAPFDRVANALFDVQSA